jgi:hypothetical protein
MLGQILTEFRMAEDYQWQKHTNGGTYPKGPCKMEHTTLRREQEDNNVGSILLGKDGQLPKQREKGQGQYGLVVPSAKAATDVTWKPPWSIGSGVCLEACQGQKTLRSKQCDTTQNAEASGSQNHRTVVEASIVRQCFVKTCNCRNKMHTIRELLETAFSIGQQQSNLC